MPDSPRPIPRSSQKPTSRESRLLDSFDLDGKETTASLYLPPEGGLKKSTSSHTIGNRHSMLAGRRSSMRLDVSSFAAENFTAQMYLKSTMEADTEEALSNALKSLTAARDKSVSELKKAVWRNHADFLAVGGEILDFEVVMVELRGLMTTLKTSAVDLVTSAGVTSMIALEETTAWKEAGSGREDRHSLAPSPFARSASPGLSLTDWEGRRQKMLALTDVIQDFQEHTGDETRYLILEGGGFHEQSGSGSAKPIILYLFNDAIAMASKKSRLVISSSAKKWTLERFWPLGELLFSDIPNSKNGENAIRVERGTEWVLLLADTPSSKRLWLQQIVKAQRICTGAGSSASSVMSPQSQPGSPLKQASPTVEAFREQPPAATASLHHRKPSSMSIKKMGETKASTMTVADIPAETIASMLALLDRLGEAIAICQYDAAVELVDKVKYELAQMDSRAPSHYFLDQKLRQQVVKLAGFLNYAISDPIISRDAMSRHVQRLVVLGFPDEAREKFLAARSDAIRARLKHLRFVGDVAKTINDMGFVTFSGIGATADLYINSFKDHTMTAGFVFWVKLEIKNYVDMIVKQVFTHDLDFRAIGDCIAIARRHCASLRDIGLELLFYMDDLFLPPLAKVLDIYQSQLEATILDALTKEDFTITTEVDNIKGISACTIKFYQALLSALNDLEPLLQIETCDLLVSRISLMLQNYSTALLQASYNPKLSSLAQLNIMGDLQFLSGIFLASLKEQLESRFHRTFATLAKLYARLEATTRALYDIFAENNANNMIPTDLSCYSATGDISKDADLSEWFSTMVPLYAKISRDTDPQRRTVLMRSLLVALLNTLDKCSIPKIQFSRKGIQQFLLDLHFLLLVSAAWLDPDLSMLGAEVGEHAVRSYREREPKEQLMSEEWYDSRARQLVQKYPLDFGQ